MFDELSKYKSKDHFFFSADDILSETCNAPKNGVGVYLVFALKKGRIELVYIGSSGKLLQNGELEIPKEGLYDRIVNGKQFKDKQKRSWKAVLELEKMETLDIYWYETFDKNNYDIPSFVEGLVMQRFFEINGRLPKWNKEY